MSSTALFFFKVDELTKVGSDQRSSTIQYDSKSKDSKRRQTVNWTWEVACWFSFSLFFENLGSYVYDSMRARTVLFLKGISAAIFSLRSCTACARVLSQIHACTRARGAARDGLTTLGVLGGSAAKWTNVVWPLKSRQTNKPTNQQTNKHTLLFYRYRWRHVWWKINLYINIWTFLYFLTILQGTRIIKKKMGSPLPFSKYRAPNIMRYSCVFLVNSHHFSPFPTSVVQWLVYLMYSHISGISKSSCKIFSFLFHEK